MDLSERAEITRQIAVEAGELASTCFRQIDTLKIEKKGHQDFVSEADREVELLVRRHLADIFPEDAIVGEEHAPTKGSSGFTWVIDPIDGTANFVSAIPAWVVVIAGVENGQTCIGVIHDPCHDETFVAVRGQGATLNGRPISVARDSMIGDGTIGVGHSNRIATQKAAQLVAAILDAGGMFHRNASGALSLAYVASGRLLGYSEAHMNAWDCLAGQLLVAEAGGRVEDQDADRMIADGGRVIVAAPRVFDDLLRLSETAFA
ncbi:inositol monophosphatase family protein [Fluviibacterium sp. DFM31]|uniref:Inositol monophosphatase family protein n=1 Tax=Meridianimarinicoccus marinus TaxID=3231483 RepID=A0ABV3LA54_9RHOB